MQCATPASQIFNKMTGTTIAKTFRMKTKRNDRPGRFGRAINLRVIVERIAGLEARRHFGFQPVHFQTKGPT
jgi:hypothetical protein